MPNFDSKTLRLKIDELWGAKLPRDLTFGDGQSVEKIKVLFGQEEIWQIPIEKKFNHLELSVEG